jgi:hypothetical protein
MASSIVARNDAGKMPLIPPPSMQSILLVTRHASGKSPRRATTACI